MFYQEMHLERATQAPERREGTGWPLLMPIASLLQIGWWRAGLISKAKRMLLRLRGWRLVRPAMHPGWNAPCTRYGIILQKLARAKFAGWLRLICWLTVLCLDA